MRMLLQVLVVKPKGVNDWLGASLGDHIVGFML